MKRKFRQWQKRHPNFITPEILDLEVYEDKIIELSKGNFLDKDIFGVTILEECNEGVYTGFKTVNTDLDKCFEDKNEAKDYIKELKENKL